MSKGYIRMALFLLIGIIIGEVRGSHTVQAAADSCENRPLFLDVMKDGSDLVTFPNWNTEQDKT